MCEISFFSQSAFKFFFDERCIGGDIHLIREEEDEEEEEEEERRRKRNYFVFCP